MRLTADLSESANVKDKNIKIRPQKTVLYVLDKRRSKALHIRKRHKEALFVFPAGGIKSDLYIVEHSNQSLN
jgi:glycerol-3-phosphate dehydrogenase